MRKVKFLILAFIVVTFCSACNGNITRDIRHAGFTVGSEFVCNNFFPEDKNDINYEKIKYFSNGMIINTDGKIYEVSLGQTFANDQNCKPAETDIVVKAIFDNKIIKGIDNRYYYLFGQNEVAAYSLVPNTDNSYNIYDMLLRDSNIVKVITADSSKGLYYVLKDDGNVYGYTISQIDRNTPPAITSTIVVYNKNDYGSKIIDFNYAGESLSTYIKTENDVYRMKIVNEENCKKYADVKCEFEMKKDSVFAEHKDAIIAFNGNMLITDYKLTFNVAS